MKGKKGVFEGAAVIGPYHLADYFPNLNLNPWSDILILGDYSERGIKIKKMLLDFSGIDIRDEDLTPRTGAKRLEFRAQDGPKITVERF